MSRSPRTSRARDAAARVAPAGALVVLSFGGLAFAGGLGRAEVGPAVADQYGPQKVALCHHVRGRQGTRHVTIRVNRSALPGHLRHGDTIGACETERSRRLHRAQAHARKFHRAAGKRR